MFELPCVRISRQTGIERKIYALSGTKRLSFDSRPPNSESKRPESAIYKKVTVKIQGLDIFFRKI